MKGKNGSNGNEKENGRSASSRIWWTPVRSQSKHRSYGAMGDRCDSLSCSFSKARSLCSTPVSSLGSVWAAVWLRLSVEVGLEPVLVDPPRTPPLGSTEGNVPIDSSSTRNFGL